MKKYGIAILFDFTTCCHILLLSIKKYSILILFLATIFQPFKLSAIEAILQNLEHTDLETQKFTLSDKWIEQETMSNSMRFSYFYKVVGVRKNNILNVRSSPGLKSKIIGSFAYNEALVEVTGRFGRWLRVNLGESSGWVYSNYLQSIKLPMIAGTEIPVGLNCFGEEPFWNVILKEKQIEFQSINDGNRVYNISEIEGLGRKTIITGMNQNGEGISVKISEQACLSSMADTHFNWRVQLTKNGSPLSGVQCCCMKK